VHQESVLEGPARAVDVAEVVDRRPFGVDSRRQGLLDGRSQQLELRGREPPGRAQRMDAGPEEGLVGIDVPDAGDPSLIEHECLDGRAPAAGGIPQVLGREPGGEWLDTDAGCQVLVSGVRSVHEVPGPEASRVDVDEPVAGSKLEPHPRVHRLDRRIPQEVARHAQVHEQETLLRQLPDQILAGPGEVGDDRALQLALHRLWWLRPCPTRIQDLGPRDRAPFQMRPELAPDRLHLGELGHG
jgi:hypothetical protein